MTKAVFWDRRARSYFQRPIADPAGYEASLVRVRAHLKPSDRVLELGCGTGGTAVELAPCVAHWVASDYSHEMIGCARERLARADAPRNVELRVAAADESVEQGAYDVVCAFNVLHLVADLKNTIRSMRARLVPSGLAISKTPCLGDRSPALRALLPVLRAVGYAPRVSFVGGTQLERAFVSEGFQIVESCTFDAAAAHRLLIARAS